MERSKSSRPLPAREAPAARAAGAPISWGVCEVPGWGHQLAPERVLAELAALGFRAVERGPEGFLPDEPAALRAMLDRHGLGLVASFVPVVLHREAERPHTLAAVEKAARAVAAAGGSLLVLAASSGQDGYEQGARLSDGEWRVLAQTLRACASVAAAHWLELAVHPHYGTAVADGEQVERLLAATEAALCLDVGHLAVAGVSALDVAASAGPRVRHVHLKDVDASLAAHVRTGQLGYHAAVQAGLYRPLGQGSSRIGEIVERLESAGYGGWYVLEQDVVLASDPPPGEGPVRDVGRSLEFLRSLAA